MTTVADERTKLLEQLILEAEKAEEPQPAKEGQIVHQPDTALPVPMVAGETLSAGYAYIYDTVTRERSVTNRNMLLVQLKKVRPDGSKVFTTVKPPTSPVRGTLTCLLHADRPERAYYDTLGLTTCRKSNLPTQFQVNQHMQHRHRVEWATIEEERTRKEKKEDRAFQQEIMRQAGKPQTVMLKEPAKRQRRQKPRAAEA